MILQRFKNWWDDPAYDNKKPMVFPDRSRGRTKPLRVLGCRNPEECKCSVQRIHGVCPCNESDKFSCECYRAE